MSDPFTSSGVSYGDCMEGGVPGNTPGDQTASVLAYRLLEPVGVALIQRIYDALPMLSNISQQLPAISTVDFSLLASLSENLALKLDILVFNAFLNINSQALALKLNSADFVPASFALASHTHPMSQVVGLSDALAATLVSANTSANTALVDAIESIPADPVASATTNGLMTIANFNKLLGITPGATAYTDAMAVAAVGPIPSQYTNAMAIAAVGPIPSQYTNEMAQDTIAAMIIPGTNITVVYDDAANTYTFNAVGGGAGGTSYSTEDAQDAIAAMLAAGTHSGITVTYNDVGNAMSLASLITQYTDAMAVAAVGPIPTQYTDEMAQDAVAAMLTAGVGITVVYNDAGNIETISVIRDYRIGWFWSTALGASEVVLIHTFTDAATFGANFPNAQGVVDGVFPVAVQTIDIQKNNVSVGTISISVTGVVTFASAGGLAVNFAVGDRMKLVGQAGVAASTNVSGSFKGSY